MIKQLHFKKHSLDIASPENVAALGIELGVHFPPAFVEFCSRWNGGFLNKESEFYPVPSTFKEFRKEAQEEGVLIHKLFGATETFPQCSLLKECTLLGDFSKLVIPIAVNLFGNRAVLRADSPMGLVYWWDHELWEIAKNPNALGNFAEKPRLIPIAQDLESFYNSLTSDPDEKL
jgi:SMI1 / KNR4 family (SUKH-1)